MVEGHGNALVVGSAVGKVTGISNAAKTNTLSSAIASGTEVQFDGVVEFVKGGIIVFRDIDEGETGEGFIEAREDTSKEVTKGGRKQAMEDGLGEGEETNKGAKEGPKLRSFELHGNRKE